MRRRLGRCVALHAAVLGSCVAFETLFERKGRRIEFGGRWQIDRSFDDRVSTAKATAYLSDPHHILAAAWPAENIVALGGSGDRLDYALRQDPINFAGLVLVDCSVDVQVSPAARGGVDLRSSHIDSVATIAGGRSKPVPMDFELSGRLEPQPESASGRGPRLLGSFEYRMSADLIGPLKLLPSSALKLAATAVNTKLALGDRFARGILAGVATFSTGSHPDEPERRPPP